MEKLGVIGRINHSEWASPLVMIPKQNEWESLETLKTK